MNNKKSNKKAMLSLEELIQLVIVVAICALVLWFLFSLLKQGSVSDSRQNLHILSDQVNLLAKKTSNFEYTRLTLTFDQGTIIRGYATLDDGMPTECDKKTCICLFKDEISYNQSKPLECSKITSSSPDAMYFYQPFGSGGDQKATLGINNKGVYSYPDSLSDYQYENLMLRFLEKDEYDRVSKKTKISNQMYIEKYVQDNKIQFMIAKVDNSNFKEENIQERINKLSLCPAGSSDGCKDVLRNTIVASGFCEYKVQTQICELSKAKPCVVGQKIEEECLCGKNLAQKGFCYGSGNYYFKLEYDCKKLDSCDDYCNIFDPVNMCNSEEMRYCELNICSSAMNCKMTTEYKKGDEFIVCGLVV